MPTHEPPSTMRAWKATRYGGPEVLSLETVLTPKPGLKEVLIKVEATTVSTADRRIRALDFPRGLGLIGRAIFGVFSPRQPILGVEFTGTIVDVGAYVSRFMPGDKVICMPGIRFGGHAEYAVMPEDGCMIIRPRDMDLQTAASLGFGGTTARDYLRRAHLQAGEKILVIGASGTVGSAIVQLANTLGAEVIGVTSTSNMDLVRDMGARQVIDYTWQDIITLGETYDVIADTIGTLNFRTALPLLAEGGRFLAINGQVPDMLARPKGTRRCIAGPATEHPEDLKFLANLATEGRFRPLIDRIIPFEDLPAAHALVDSARKRGSVVISKAA